MMVTPRRVVVTGMGVVSPIGHTVNDFWQAIQEGKCGVDTITAFDASRFKVKLAAEVKDFDSSPYFAPHDLKRNSKFMMYARIAAQQAYRDSGLAESAVERDRMGVYVSSSIGGLDNLEDATRVLADQGPDRISPYLIPTTLVNLASGAIAIDIQAKGSNLAIVTACASGANSIGEAFHKIRSGTEDVILAGASDAAITPTAIAGFAAMRAMHTGSDPQRASIPFDAERSGMVMGEGAGVLVLEALDLALQRQAPIYGEVIGYGSNCDAYSITAPDYEGVTVGRAIAKAMDDAGVNADQIDYINAHGTATVLNDRNETQAIKQAFGDHANRVPVSSTKSMTGHMLGAGGAVEAIACIMAMRDGVIPATINYRVPDPACDLCLVTGESRRQDLDIVLSNSFGFGGHNASLIFKKWSGHAEQ